jgi:putative glutamine amidotransferase
VAEQQKPLIAVTGPERGGWPAWFFTRIALMRAGARAVRVTPARPIEVERIDGLVLGGGADVTVPLQSDAPEPPPPAAARWWPRRVLDLFIAPLVLVVRLIAGLLAGARPHGADPARDRLERALLGRARELQLPVLGICRGAQLMNVLEGGSLHHAVEVEERPQLYTVLPRREVTTEPGSALQSLLGRSRLLVNSLHFHAIAEPGQGLYVVAREPSGVVQAIEHRSRPFWLGVQWHPEYLPQQIAHQRLFHGLVEHARRYRAGQRPQAAAQSQPIRANA